MLFNTSMNSLLKLFFCQRFSFLLSELLIHFYSYPHQRVLPFSLDYRMLKSNHVEAFHQIIVSPLFLYSLFDFPQIYLKGQFIAFFGVLFPYWLKFVGSFLSIYNTYSLFQRQKERPPPVFILPIAYRYFMWMLSRSLFKVSFISIFAALFLELHLEYISDIIPRSKLR